MSVLWTALGIVLIGAALRDIFDTLFHPVGRGRIGRRIVGAASWFPRHVLPGRSGEALAGPLAYLTILAFWATMLVLGWALVFLPHLPEGFLFASGLDPADHDGFADAVYVSLVNLTSLGYGDVTPQETGLRILGPIETMFGLGLLTASISWLISIYGAIARRDVFAHEVWLARESEERLGEKLADADPELLERMLTSFTDQLITTRRDLIHFPITHQFRTEEEERALSRQLPFLGRMVEEASEDGRPKALRVRAEGLRMAMDDFAETLRRRLKVEGDSTEATLEAFDAR